MEKTIQQQYDLIKEGKGNKDDFLKSARRVFPELITPGNDYNTAVHILKSKSILSEGTSTVTANKNWFKIFETNLKEAVGVKDTKEYGDQNTFEKIDKDVKAALDHQFDNSNAKNIDNVYGQSFLIGYLAEMDDPKNAKKTVDELKAIVLKNMAKDINYYAKNGMFGVKGIGLETSKVSKPLKGKFKSSGYGDLKENKIPQFKKGDKVTYLGHPGEITGINKEMTGDITYNLYYNKGEGRTKVSNLSNKGGEIKKSIKENKLRSVIRNLINEELN
jgi:hypothetical protein